MTILLLLKILCFITMTQAIVIKNSVYVKRSEVYSYMTKFNSDSSINYDLQIRKYEQEQSQKFIFKDEKLTIFTLNDLEYSKVQAFTSCQELNNLQEGHRNEIKITEQLTMYQGKIENNEPQQFYFLISNCIQGEGQRFEGRIHYELSITGKENNHISLEYEGVLHFYLILTFAFIICIMVPSHRSIINTVRSLSQTQATIVFVNISTVLFLIHLILELLFLGIYHYLGKKPLSISFGSEVCLQLSFLVLVMFFILMSKGWYILTSDLTDASGYMSNFVVIFILQMLVIAGTKMISQYTLHYSIVLYAVRVLLFFWFLMNCKKTLRCTHGFNKRFMVKFMFCVSAYFLIPFFVWLCSPIFKVSYRHQIVLLANVMTQFTSIAVLTILFHKHQGDVLTYDGAGNLTNKGSSVNTVNVFKTTTEKQAS